jgi:hypothetical protein
MRGADDRSFSWVWCSTLMHSIRLWSVLFPCASSLCLQVNYCFTFIPALLHNGISQLEIIRNGISVHSSTDSLNYTPTAGDGPLNTAQQMERHTNDIMHWEGRSVRAERSVRRRCDADRCLVISCHLADAGMYFGSNGPSGPTDPWTGEMDEFRVWTTKLTVPQCLAGYKNALTFPLPQLRLYLSFNEEAGQDPQDYSSTSTAAWVGGISGSISRTTTNPLCLVPSVLRNLQVQAGDNSPLPYSPAFQPRSRATMSITMANDFRPSSAIESVGTFTSSCTLAPFTPLIGDTACTNIPVGGNCSFTCPVDQYLYGGVLVCQPNGEFIGQQFCQVPFGWFSVGSLGSSFQRAGMAYCATTQTLFLGGRYASSSGNDDLYMSKDFGATWNQLTDFGGARGGCSMLLCDGAGTLHVIGGMSSNNAIQSTDSGVTWGAAIPMTGSVARYGSGHALIPSSGWMDYLIVSGGSNAIDAWRFNSATQSFTCVCASLPWASRWSGALVYSTPGQALFIGGGAPGETAAANGPSPMPATTVVLDSPSIPSAVIGMLFLSAVRVHMCFFCISDVWSSVDDGRTWRVILGPGSERRNSYWAGRVGAAVWTYGGIVMLAFGSTRTAATGGIVNG